MLLEFHMLKNFPPVNLNRDDTGAPKTCTFGGATRGRISSQCLKRSWRKSAIFCEEIGSENLGIRTRKLPELVAERLLKMGFKPELTEAASKIIAAIGKKEAKENSKKPKEEEKSATATKQIIFYAPQDIDAVANAVKTLLDKCETVKDVQKIKSKDLEAVIEDADIRPITLDIALFGRMVTCDAFRNVEAAMQVAHAISTNRITVESDYFTAMDDLLSGENMEEAGAGMIGDTDYNASCYYIYASIDTDTLKESLKFSEDADTIIKKAIPALLKAIAFTNPSGKQNSFAGHILPSCFMVECKERKIPVSLVNAFVKPVQGWGKDSDLIKDSIQKLAEEADSIKNSFDLPATARLWFTVDKYNIQPQCATETFNSFSELVNAVSKLI
ncbi:MAG: type I-E CRISPR-associated protein Cas7/Cse4/CasC [Succinimonas sp.]|nr:type I-E CRISPR-associated protein Cas7/Cse4/CasC [Succinimonas sp.]